MIRALSPARRGAAALLAVGCAIVLSASAALAQNAPGVSVNPDNGPAGSTTNLTLRNFDFLPQCNAAAGTPQTCIEITFVQGTRTTTIAFASGSAPTPTSVRIPAACTAPANTNCSDTGPATIHAHSPNGQDATTGFTVSGAPPPATTTTAGATTTSSSTTSSSTSSSTSTSTTVTTVVLPAQSTTTTTIATKKASSSHSDVPRYIAVVLVVLAAAGTAAVDTQLRRMKAPPGPGV